MQIKLTHYWAGHSPGDVVDVDDTCGAEWLADGRAVAVEQQQPVVIAQAVSESDVESKQHRRKR